VKDPAAVEKADPQAVAEAEARAQHPAVQDRIPEADQASPELHDRRHQELLDM